MITAKFVLLIVLAYFLGNISPSILIGKFYGIDVKKEGSGNAGTTNMLRLLGWKAAVVTLLIDILKGVLAVYLAKDYCGLTCAEFAVVAVALGHIFPIIYKFKGGKGIATSFGAVFALNWPSAFAALLVALAGAALSKKMSVGSIASVITYPLFVAFYYVESETLKFMPIAIFMALLLLFTHRENIKRLIRGEENELNFGQTTEEAEEIVEGDEISAVGSIPTDKSMAFDMSKLDPKVVEAINTVHKSIKVDKEVVDFYKGEKFPKLTEEQKKKIAVIGSGSFGTAIANMLANKGHSVTLYGKSKTAIDKLKADKVNKKHLPGVKLTGKLRYTSNIKTAAFKRNIVIFAVPAQQFSKVAEQVAKFIDDEAVVVNLAKGIDKQSCERMSQVSAKILSKNKYVALAGPLHAQELARNCPARVVVASTNKTAAEMVQQALSTEKFTVDIEQDVIGVEIGGAIKNVIAIAAGMSEGAKLAEDAKAEIVNRGIREMIDLGVALGAKQDTFMGLSGVGDVMVTCASELSRNRKYGKLLSEGKATKNDVSRIGTIEGLHTAPAAVAVADKKGVDIPVVQAVADVISSKSEAVETISKLIECDEKGKNN